MVLRKFSQVEQKPLAMEDVVIPEVKPGYIRIKVENCGVCHTDLHTVEGEIRPAKLPIIPGHEVIGRIESLSPSKTTNPNSSEKSGSNYVDKLSVGDRVGVAWLYKACGKCKYCNRRQENLCDSAMFTGFHANGGYAEYMVVPEQYAYPIPSIFSSKDAAPLMCAGVIGYRSYRLSKIKQGERLGLFGFGASAHIVIQLANYFGIETYVFTRSKNHQEHAKELGAVWVGSSKDSPPNKVDRAIMFAPAGALVHDALKNIDKGGTLAINAVYLSDIPQLSYNLIYHERELLSVANVTRQDALEFLDIAGKIPIKTTTTEYDLADANSALYDMKHSKIDGAAVLKI